MLPELSPEELNSRLASGEDIQLIDVRQPEEYDYCRITGSHLIPLGELAQRVNELDETRPIVLVCHHGVRSMQALAFLQHRHNMTNLLNLRGGIHAWSLRVDPTVAIY